MTESLAGIEKNWCSLQYIGFPAITMFSYTTVGSKISHPAFAMRKKNIYSFGDLIPFWSCELCAKEKRIKISHSQVGSLSIFILSLKKLNFYTFLSESKIQGALYQHQEISIYNMSLKCSKKRRLFMPLADVSFTEGDFTLIYLKPD